MPTVNTYDAQKLLTVKTKLKEVYADSLSKVILFGSHARNNASTDSDIDLLVVQDRETFSTYKEIDRITELLYGWIMENMPKLSIHPISLKDFVSGQTPLLHFVKKEGIEL